MKYLIQHPVYITEWQTDQITTKEIIEKLSLSNKEVDQLIASLIYTGVLIEIKETSKN